MEIDGNKKTLFSYLLPIATIENKKAVIICNESDISSTTLKHLKEFLLQEHLQADTKKQILADYMEV